MKTFRFRDFIIYKTARHFRRIVQGQLRSFPKSEQYCLVDQIHRSCLSIILNIAEGSAKGSDKDFARFLTIAIGSVNEVIAGFDAASDDGIVDIANLHQVESTGELLAKQIGGFIQKLRRTQRSQLPIAKSQ